MNYTKISVIDINILSSGRGSRVSYTGFFSVCGFMPSELYQLTKTTKKGDLRLNSSKLMSGVLEIVTLKKAIFYGDVPWTNVKLQVKRKQRVRIQMACHQL